MRILFMNLPKKDGNLIRFEVSNEEAIVEVLVVVASLSYLSNVLARISPSSVRFTAIDLFRLDYYL